ncbi:MFS transporter [Curtobacterium sp. ISL-83]|nr:MFS transporter [Curtobacterium sp. ISL-83]
MTFPGQTAGLSAFTDPLIRALHASRTEISTSYLIGTLLGALAQPLFGRALDRWGARRIAILVTLAFALILIAVSFAEGITGLTLGFVGLRMTGQGALSLAATTAIARAVHHRRGLALGITSAIGSGGVSLAPIGIEHLLLKVGYANTWRWEAAALILIVIPLALLLPRPRAARTATGSVVVVDGWTAKEAARSGMFWVLAGTVATSSMLGTGLAFHQIALLGQQGLTPIQAAANFLPQTVTSLLATLLAGALVDRLPPKLVMCFAMLTLAAAMLMLPLVSTTWSATLYGLVLGAAGGSLRGIEVATYVRYYGQANIGSIRGIAIGIAIASSALGPLALAAGHDITGTFTTPVTVLAAIPVLMAVLALIVRTPRRQALALDLR